MQLIQLAKKYCKGSIVSILLMMVIVLSSPMFANAAEIAGTCNGQDAYQEGDWYYIMNDDEETVAIVGWDGTVTTDVIPETLGEMEVTRIASMTFGGDPELEHLTIPENVTSIDSGAFERCGKIKSIEITSNLKSIEYMTFQGCSSLESITLPDGLLEIGMWAFGGCSALKDITIPDSVKSIGMCAFQSCSSLESIKLSNSLTSIEQQTFDGCSGLESITIPEGVTSIAHSVFEDCSNLQSIVIPSTVTNIEATFSGCSENMYLVVNADSYVGALASLRRWNYWAYTVNEDGETATIIDGYAKGTVADIPDSLAGLTVTHIGDYAFTRWDDLQTDGSLLQTINIPESVTYIGNGAFSECKGLQNITLPDGITSIGSYAFEYCYSLQSIAIPSGVTEIGERTFAACSKLENVTLPDTITTIGEEAFSSCGSLKSFTMPSKVTGIAEGLFKGCSSLEAIELSEKITEIGEYAFWSCDNLESVRVPDTVTSIGKDAFDITGYSGFCLVVDAGSYAEEYAIENEINYIVYDVNEDGTTATITKCHLVSDEIIIPSIIDGKTVTAIGSGVFAEDGDFRIHLPSSVKDIAEDAFINVNNDNEEDGEEDDEEGGPYTLVVEEGSYAEQYAQEKQMSYYLELEGWLYRINEDGVSVAIENCPKEWKHSTNANLEIPATLNGKKVTCIVDEAFHSSYLKTANIPEGVTSIGEGAFSSCRYLKSVEIPSSVTSIGMSAFSSSKSLSSITIPSSVVDIGRDAFSGTSWLTKQKEENTYIIVNNILIEGSNCEKVAEIPEGVTKIGDGAFKDCESLESVIIPLTVTSIGEEAFALCTSLKSIIIPSSVTTIEYGAFSGCSNMENITIPSSVVNIGDVIFGGYYVLDMETDESEYQGCSDALIVKADEGSVAANYAIESGFTVKPIDDVSSEEKHEHVYDTEWTIDKTATCKEAGSKSRHCTVENCAEKTDVTDIAKTTHSWDNGKTPQGTTSVVYTCTVCGETQTENSADTSTDNSSNDTTEQPDATKELPKVGTKITIGNGQYKITKSSAKSKEVSYVKPKSSKKTSATIPATVKISGYKYKVTAIADKAFRKNTKIKSVTIGKYVTKIGKEAFNGCKKLKKITIKSAVLKSVGKNAIKGIHSKATIKVPKKQLSKYKKLFKSKTGYKKTMKIKK